jgi:catechol 2,3-dioxygenase
MTILSSSISRGSVMLRVADLDAMTRYYSDVLGLKVIGEDQSSRVLGGDKGSALVLISAPELKHASPSDAGLFHTAFLYSSRSALATAVSSIARSYPESFTGSADHIVSEAFYFDDPEGNGVELYFDRERTGWSWQHGQIMMDTLYLDPNKYLSEHLRDPLVHEYPVIGHVHLSVGNISLAKEFYVDTLGFEVTLNWGGTALFVSAGGYHHHMAMNIWRIRGAGTSSGPEAGIMRPASTISSNLDFWYGVICATGLPRSVTITRFPCLTISKTSDAFCFRALIPTCLSDMFYNVE